MPNRHPEILYFAPSDPMKSPFADYSRRYLSALQQHPDMTAMAVLHGGVPENLHGHANGISLIKKLTALSLRRRRAVPDQVLHVDLGDTTQREFWAAQQASRLRDKAPMCILFQTPPDLPDPVRPPGKPAKRNIIDRFLNYEGFFQPLSRKISNYCQDHLESAFLNRASVFLCLSHRAGEMIVHRYPEHAHKVALIPPILLGPPPPENIKPNERKRSQPVMITFLGFVRPGKGFEELIRALAFLHKRESLVGRVKMRIRGRITKKVIDSGLENRIRRCVRDLHLDWMVDFKPGAMTEAQINNLLLDTDILVLPYQAGGGESASMSLMRAKAWAVAAIASDVGALRESIEHERDGLLYPAGDVIALADCLHRLISEPDTRMEYARALHRKAFERNSPEKVASTIYELYCEMLDARDENRPVLLPEGTRIAESVEPPLATPKIA